MLQWLSEAGIAVKEDANKRLNDLAALIEEWNNRINLISRKDIDRLVDYHFGDSLSLLPILQPEGKLKALDIGGSNGLPGIVIGAVTDTLEITVCDLKHKREAFMKDACEIAGENTRFLPARADEDGFRIEHTGRFDLVVARAVGALPQLLKWSIPLLRDGGLLVAYKGSRLANEVGRVEKLLPRAGVDLLLVIGSPWAGWCNPLRKFAIVRKQVERCQG